MQPRKSTQATEKVDPTKPSDSTLETGKSSKTTGQSFQPQSPYLPLKWKSPYSRPATLSNKV